MTTVELRPAHRHGDEPLSHPTVAQRRQALLAGVLLLVLTVTTALAAFSSPPADEWAYTVVRGWGWLEPLAWLEVLLLPPVLAALSAFLLLGARCRTYPLVAVGALLVGIALGELLAVLVARDRPAESLTVTADSYPSSALVALTVLAGLVPSAIESATRSAALRRVAGAVLAVLVTGVALVEVATAARWPLDVLGAVLLGTLLVLAARVLLEEPHRHPWCRGCLWQDRAAEARELAPVLIEIDPRRARVLHRVTLLWAAGLVAAYSALAATVGMPRTPESGVMGSGLELPVQWGSLALIVVGVLVARRWHVTGAFLVAFAAAVLGYAASVEYPPWVALAVLLTAWVPALLLWLEWHRRTTLRAALAAAVAASVVLGAVTGASAATYSYFWGPTHPRSVTAAPATDDVEWMWVGGVTSTSAEVRLRLAEPARQVRVVASEDEELAVAAVAATAEPDAAQVVAVRLAGLTPGTRYHYAAEVDGRLVRERIQSFETFPAGPASFTVALGSCQLGGSNGVVFDALRALDPLLFLSMGDWHYGNVEANDPELFRDQYQINLTAPAQAALYAQTAVAYVWGDHDYDGNDADRTAPSRPAAMQVYRQMVPHYPLAGPQAAVYQAFTVGRVRFLLTDTRASRDPVGQPSGPFRSTLGAEQRDWLLAELAQADRYGLVVWVNPDPWVAGASPGSDTWGGFAEERQLIADTIAARGVDNLLMVSGDAHMLAFDDGSNTDFSSTGVAGFPLFHAAAIDRPGSAKGGPYTGRVLPGGGQFGTIDVTDTGSVVEVRLTGWRWDSSRLFTEVLRFPAGS